MKKLILILLATLIFISCNTQYKNQVQELSQENEQLKYSVDSLERKLKECSDWVEIVEKDWKP